MTKRFGFTLAEVLITLGIIGVVAAMTIPTLIANTNSAKFRSQFKKSISTLNQAGLMGQAQYDFDYAGTSTACTAASGGTEKPTDVMTFCALLNGTLSGQTYNGALSNIKRNNNGTEAVYKTIVPTGYTGSLGFTNDKTPDGYLAYTLADGSIVAFNKGALGCTLPAGTQMTSKVLAKANGADGTEDPNTGGLANCIGFIDVNGATLPNKEVTCKGNKATNAVETPCIVPNDANHMTDIYPIVFHDATVEPASDAAKFVLTSAK